MRLFSKTTACLCALIIAASAVTVISVSAAQSTAPSASAAQTESGNTEKTSDNVKLGKVTAVDGNKIIVALGEFASKTKTAENGTADRKSEAKTKKKTSGSAEAQNGSSSAEDSENAAEKSGRKHSHKGRRRGEFSENGTTLTVTVTDKVTIEKKGETAAVSEISEGDIIRLGYDDDGELTSVKLGKGHRHGRKSNSETASNENMV